MLLVRICLSVSMRVWLASGSARRRVILESILPRLHCEPLPEVDETPPLGLVEEQVLAICQRKAAHVNEHLDYDLIIVSDTMIGDPDDAYASIGKPIDRGEAGIMLSRLANRRHQVWTASGLFFGGQWSFDVEHAVMEFPEFSSEFLSEYLASEEWKGKAGAYDLHGSMGSHATLIQGSEYVVLGLTQRVIEVVQTFATNGE